MTAQSKAKFRRNLKKGEPSIAAVPSPTAGVGQASQPDLLPRPGRSSCLHKRARSRLRGLDLTRQVALVPHSPCLSWSIVPGLAAPGVAARSGKRPDLAKPQKLQTKSDTPFVSIPGRVHGAEAGASNNRYSTVNHHVSLCSINDR